MLTNQLAHEYAQAIFELASVQNKVDDFEHQLETLRQSLKENEQLSDFLYQPRVPAQAKKELVRKMFSEVLNEVVCNFVLLLLDKGRETILPAIVDEYVSIANQARNISEAEVTTALPLTADQKQALIAKITEITGKNIVLKEQLDERIMGGVILKYGDKLIDGSVATQLDNLKSTLLKNQVTKIGVTN